MELSLKNKWIEALRSGDYKQRRNRLKEGNAYCCLGVLRHVVDPKDTVGLSILSEDQLEKYKLQNVDARNLMGMNDSLGKDAQSFSQIADWIEENIN